MDPEEDLDTHICLRCHSTIVGLDDYVKHKKTECPALTKTNSPIKTERNICESSNSETNQPNNCQPTPTATILLDSRDAASPDPSELRQDAFLTMLELQCKNSPAKGTTPISPRNAPSETTVGLTLPELDFSKSELDRNDDNVNYELLLEPMSDHDENEDFINPPKNHTGGKWKPGQGPKSNCSSGKWLQSAEKADHDYDGHKQDKMEIDDDEDEIDKRQYCEVCDKYLGTKLAYNKHFNSYSHLKRVNGLSSSNIDKSEEICYNCAVCQKNLSSKFAYLRHASSPLHLRKVKMSKGEVANPVNISSVRKSSRRICKNKLLNDQIWTLDNNDDDKEDDEDEENGQNGADTSGMSCEFCKRTFQSKRNFAHHLLTPLHLKRAENRQGKWELIFKHLDLLTKFSPFQCAICSYYFNNVEYFLEHWQSDIHAENVSTMIGPFLCVECEHVCNSNEEMLQHLKCDEHTDLVSTLDKKHPIIVKEKRTDLFCKVCDLKLPTAFAFKKHSESAPHQKMVNKNVENGSNVTKEKMFKCNSCVEEFADSAALEAHKLTHMDEEGKDDEKKSKPMKIVRTCSACDQVITTGILGEVTEHLCPKLQEIADTDTVKFLCLKCNYVCNSTTQLLYHQTLHEKPEVTPLNDNSNKEVENEAENEEAAAEMKTIRKKKGLRTVKKFKCTYCNKLYPKSALLAHLNTHTGEKPFKCNLCSLSFAQRGTLYMHLKRHTGVKQFKCDQCSFAAEKPSRLKRHKETHNINRPRAHLCDVCGAGYHDRWSLKHHMKVHFGKDLKCPVENCPQAFRCPSELQMHMRVHNDERPFLCDKCGYRGRSQHQLTKHRRSHTGERPFKCPHCSYSAHLSPHLMRHMRIHTGAKPYKCPYCDYTCNTQENVRKHILKTKKHEGKKMYPCRFCDYSTNSAAEYKTHTLENHKDLVSAEDTDVISLLAGVYNRTDNIKTTNEPIPYIPRQERMKNNIGKPKKKKRVRKVEEIISEPHIFTIQLADAEHILQTFEGGNGEQIFFPVDQEQATEICTQVEEQSIEVPPMEEETIVTSTDVSNAVINPEGQNMIYIYLQESIN